MKEGMNGMYMDGENRSYEIRLVALLFFGWGFIFLDRLAISFLLPVIVPQMHLTNAQVGQINMATTLAYAISAIVFGMMSDNSGFRKRWLVPFVFSTAIFSGLSATTSSFSSLLVIRALVGASEGPILPLAMAMIAASAPKKMGFYSGIVNSGVAIIAVTLGPILITQIVGHTSWQMSFLLASLPSFILAFLLLKFTNEVPSRTQSEASQQAGMKWSNFTELLKYRNVVLCALISSFTLSAYWILMLFAPLYWVKVAHLSEQTMGLVASAMGLMAIVWTPLIPKLTDNFGRKPVLIGFTLLGTLTPLTMFLFNGNFISIAVYVSVGLLSGALAPIFMTVIPMETVPETLRATANAFIMAAGEVIGGALIPVIAGNIADRYGLPDMMLIAAVALLLAAILGLALIESHPNKANALNKSQSGSV